MASDLKDLELSERERNRKGILKVVWQVLTRGKFATLLMKNKLSGPQALLRKMVLINMSM